MRIGLAADLHLDKRLGTRHDEAGVNLRSRDLEAATRAVVDGFIGAAPDVVAFLGDLYDNAKPSERSRQFLVGEIRRLQAALPGTTIILIRGNHDASTAFSDATAVGTTALALTDVIVADAFEKRVVEIGDVAFTLVPWMRNDAAFVETIETLTPVEGKQNILLLHAGMADLPEYAEMRPGSQTITRSLIPAGFEVFSGHFHGHRRFPDLHWTFVGSPERLSVSEVGQPKGWVSYDTESHEIALHPVPTREWYDLGQIDASAMDAAAIADELDAIRETIPSWADALIRIRVTRIRPEVAGAIDPRRISALRASAFYCDLELRVEAPELSFGTGESEDPVLLEDLAGEWSRFVERISRDELDRERIKRLGLAALEGGSLEGEAAVGIALVGKPKAKARKVAAA